MSDYPVGLVWAAKHELQGVEQTMKVEHNDHWGWCVCGWHTDKIRLDDDEMSNKEARYRVQAHINSLSILR